MKDEKNMYYTVYWPDIYNKSETLDVALKEAENIFSLDEDVSFIKGVELNEDEKRRIEEWKEKVRRDAYEG